MKFGVGSDSDERQFKGLDSSMILTYNKNMGRR